MAGFTQTIYSNTHMMARIIAAHNRHKDRTGREPEKLFISDSSTLEGQLADTLKDFTKFNVKEGKTYCKFWGMDIFIDPNLEGDNYRIESAVRA